jgi:hypothetical protein
MITGMVEINADPAFDGLRSEPHFQARAAYALPAVA